MVSCLAVAGWLAVGSGPTVRAAVVDAGAEASFRNAQPEELVRLAGPRGAVESFQLVIRAGGATEVRAVAQPFDGLVAGVEAFVVEKPDALRPLGEEPVAVRPGATLTMWVDVEVPTTAAPGTYRGAVALVAPERRLTFPLELTVWPLSVPATASLPVRLGVDRDAALRARELEPGGAGDALLLQYEMAGLRHRISLAGLAPSASGPDWAAYDAFFGPLLDGSAAGGARMTLLDLQLPTTLADAQADEVARHLSERGWADRAVLVLEAGEAAAQRLRADALRRAVPGGRVIGPGLPQRPLFGATDGWSPAVCEVDREGVHEALRSRLAAGESVFWRVSNAGAKCGPAEGPGFATLDVRRPPMAPRALPWLAWLYGASGLTARAPLGSTERATAGLFYDSPMLSAGDAPMASVRLKRLREGLVDYELLVLLESETTRLTAERVAMKIARRADDWETDPGAYAEARAWLVHEIVLAREAQGPPLVTAPMRSPGSGGG